MLFVARLSIQLRLANKTKILISCCINAINALFTFQENDISLLDNASLTLQTMTITFGRVDYGKNMLNNQFIPQLRQLIRSTKESIRHEGLSIMGKAVQHCGDLNSVLLSLRRLRKPDEPEVDFFENSRHLQTHRRSRALLRYVYYYKEIE